MKEIEKKFIIQPYNFTCFVIITDNILESRKKRNKILSESELLEEPKGLHCDAGTLNSYVFIKYNSLSDTISHEAYHVVCKLMRDIGAKHEEEIIAYTIGYIVRKIVLILNKENAKSN